MLHLYYKPSCPFCQRVLAANEQIGAELKLLDVSEDESLREELIAKGGKKQVPFLVDYERSEMMYESDVIVAYLNANYGSGGAITTEKPANVCPIE